MKQDYTKIEEEFKECMIKRCGKWKIGRAEAWQFIIKHLQAEYKRGLKDAKQPTIKHNRGGGFGDLI